MTGPPMVHVDAERLYKDLRALLYERFRNAFLDRERRGDTTPPSRAIEAAAQHFLFDRPDTRREIQKALNKHVTESRASGSGSFAVYAPELLKSLVYDIGREARAHRYDGRVQAELKVQSSRVFLHQIRPP
jgi:hypothetical protein